MKQLLVKQIDSTRGARGMPPPQIQASRAHSLPPRAIPELPANRIDSCCGAHHRTWRRLHGASVVRPAGPNNQARNTTTSLRSFSLQTHESDGGEISKAFCSICPAEVMANNLSGEVIVSFTQSNQREVFYYRHYHRSKSVIARAP